MQQNPYAKNWLTLLSAAISLGACGFAYSTPSQPGSRLYAPCVVCHQPRAWGSTDGVIPSLAGQRRLYLEKQLALFRAAARDDVAKRLVVIHEAFSNEASSGALAGYLSQLDANPSPVTGSGDHLRVGQELYAHICAACHGDLGQGQRGSRVPRIGGQHFPYLRQQIELAADLHKESAPPEMTSALRSMQPQEKDALADYISRLGHAAPLIESKHLDDATTGQHPQLRARNKASVAAFYPGAESAGIPRLSW